MGVRDRYADPKKAEACHERSAVYRACHLVETYKLTTTIPIHYEDGERPKLQVGGFPFYCFGVSAAEADDMKSKFTVTSSKDELLEEKKIIQKCREEGTALEKSAE